MGVSALELRRRVLMAQPHKERKTGGIVSFKTHVPQVLGVAVPLSPVQAGTGNPYPPGGGKNLLNVTASTTTVNGVTYTIESDGAIKLSGTASARSVFKFAENFAIKAGTYKINGSPQTIPAGCYLNFNFNGLSVSETMGAFDVPFTLDEDVTTDYARIDIASGTNTNGFVFKPMIRLASDSDATFAPYSNIRPITGWTGATAYRTGKNRLPNNATNESKSQNGVTITSKDGVYSFSGTSTVGTTVIIPLSASVDISPSTSKIAFLNNKAVTIDVGFHRSGHGRIHYWQMNSVNRVGSGWTDTGNEVVDGIQITIPSGLDTTGFVVSPMLVLLSDTNPTTFEPYAGESYPVTFPETVYVGTLDAVNGVLKVTHAMLTKNTADMNSTLENYPGWIHSGIRDIVGGGLNATLTVLSNIGTRVGVNTTNANDTLFLAKAIYGKTKEEWVSLAIDVQVVAELAEPLIVSLTPAEIRALMGENNVFADTGDVDVEFWTN